MAGAKSRMRDDRLPMLLVFALFCSFLLFFALWLSSSAFWEVPGKPLRSRPFELITIGIDSARRGDAENLIFEAPLKICRAGFAQFCSFSLFFTLFCTILPCVPFGTCCQAPRAARQVLHNVRELFGNLRKCGFCETYGLSTHDNTA